METGSSPAENGEPETTVRLPSGLVGLPQLVTTWLQMENADTLLEPELATYRKPPSGVMARADGAVPTGSETPCVSAPEVVSTAYIVTVLSNWLAMYKNLPSGVTATAEGPVPLGASAVAVGNGEPGTCVRVASCTEKTETVPDAGLLCCPWLTTNRKWPPESMARLNGIIPADCVP